jgi:hypothetical protein
MSTLNYTISIPAAFYCPWVNRLCPQPQPSHTSAAVLSTHVDAATVSAWLCKFNNSFSRFERITNHGLYSNLEKGIQEMTPLLSDGQKITSSPTHYLGVSAMINDLVKPRLAQLQMTYAAAQKKLVEHPKEKEEDIRLAQKWEKLGLPMSVLENHADCARFLIESGLAFVIVGYRESCRSPDLHDLKLDGDGHPMLKMQGRYVRWETISREIHYDSKLEKIKSRDYPGSIVQSWNYFHENGLVPADRFEYDQVFPVYELTQEEYHRTHRHALKFYETNPEKDPGILKDCIVQFTTIENRVLPEGALFDNAQRNYPVHIGMRLITPDRKVYSFGYQLLPEEAQFILSDYFSTLLTTAEAKIGMRDFEEFRPVNKLVTSIPLSSQRAQNIINLLNHLNGKQLRFQYMRQNCSQLMREVIQLAGYDVDLRTSGKEVLWDALPGLTQLPVIGKVAAFVKKMWTSLPTFMSIPIEFTADVILYLPRKTATVVTNMLAWKMGAAKKTIPLQSGVEDEEFYDKKKLQTFSSLIRSWTDIFTEETNAVYHSKYFVDWQNKQKSTFKDVYSGRPKFAIVPPTA